MRLLVTGGAGFIGSNVVQCLVDRPEIELLINLDCLTYAGHLVNVRAVENHPRYRFEKVDLRDKAEVLRVVRQHRITHVLHLAAESHVDRSITGPGEFIHTNVVGTFHLLEACRQTWQHPASGHPLPGASVRFHQVSTDEVYGSLGPLGRFSETNSYAPNSPYSASKAAADMFVRAYGQTYALPVVITNSCNIYGPRQFPEKLIPVTIRSVINHRPIPLYGDGMNVRDWLYVRDQVEALWQVLTRGQPGQSYNIGADNEWPNLRIVESICDLVDELAPHLGGRSRQLIQFVPDRPGHDRRYALDSTKIRTELGWKPEYTFERGLRETVRWYLENQDWVRTVLIRVTHPPVPRPP